MYSCVDLTFTLLIKQVHGNGWNVGSVWGRDMKRGWRGGQGPGYAGSQAYTEVFAFLSSGLQRTTGVGGDPGGGRIRKR